MRHLRHLRHLLIALLLLLSPSVALGQPFQDRDVVHVRRDTTMYEDFRMWNGYGLHFIEASGNGADTVAFTAPASIAADVMWVLPSADGSADECLTTDGAETLAWGACLIGVLTTGSDGDSTTTSSDSGLELIGGDVTMLRGCADGEVLAWVEATDTWDCSTAGGVTDHTALTNLAWPSSGHTGTAYGLAAFSSGGAAINTADGTVVLAWHDGDERLGIGTTSPEYLLHADGTGIAAQFTRDSALTTVLGSIHIENDNVTDNNWAGLTFVGAETDGGARSGGGIYTQFTGKTSAALDGEVSIYAMDGTAFRQLFSVHGQSSRTRIYGTDAANELGELYVASSGQFILSTENSNDSVAYVGADGNDNAFGFLVFESNTGTDMYANLYAVDAATDYLSVSVASGSTGTTTDALNVTAGDDVGVGTATPTDKFTVVGGNIGVDNQGDVRWYEGDAGGANYLAMQAPATVASNITWTLPSTDSTGTECLASDGAGTMSWQACSGGGGTPGGSDTYVQVNQSGSFYGEAELAYDYTSNHLGIGGAPSVALDVDSNSNTDALRLRGTDATNQLFDAWVSATGSVVMTLVPGTETDQYFDIRPEDDQWGFLIRESDGTGTAAYGNLYVTDGATDYMSITVTSAEDDNALNITSGDDVGIGRFDPQAKLHVEDSGGGQEALQEWTASDSSDWLRVKNATSSNTIMAPALWSNVSSVNSLASMYLIAEAGTDTGSEGVMVFDSRRASAAISTRPLYEWRSYGAANTYMLMDASGQLGVGTESPDTVLDVEGTTSSQMFVSQSSGTGNVGMALRIGGTGRLYTDVLYAAGAYTARIRNLYGAIQIHTGTGGSATERWRFLSGGQVNVSGNVAVASTSMGSAPTAALDVYGDSVRIRTSQTPGTSDACSGGEVTWDTSYIYVCTATNDWKRAALTDY